MSRPYLCDQCGYSQPTALAFEVLQQTTDVDDDGEPVPVTLHLCSPSCLSDFAMGLSLDFPEGDDT